MEINKELVEKLKLGEIALHFGGRGKDKEAVQQLNKVLDLATGQRHVLSGVYNYYYLTTKGDVDWSVYPRLGKEIVELEKFFITEEKQAPKQGDVVWIKYQESGVWEKMQFISFIEIPANGYKIAAMNEDSDIYPVKFYSFEDPNKLEIEEKIKELESKIESLKQQLK